MTAKRGVLFVVLHSTESCQVTARHFQPHRPHGRMGSSQPLLYMAPLLTGQPLTGLFLSEGGAESLGCALCRCRSLCPSTPLKPGSVLLDPKRRPPGAESLPVKEEGTSATSWSRKGWEGTFRPSMVLLKDKGNPGLIKVKDLSTGRPDYSCTLRSPGHSYSAMPGLIKSESIGVGTRHR